MSTLSYIKGHKPFILIGGCSGIGKTSIIDALISDYPSIFEQPKSLTSRTKRIEDERYEFTTKVLINEAFLKGELLNLDIIQDEHYAVRSESVALILASGKIPIKEVHPDNFHKFINFDYNIVTVLVMNKHLSSANELFIRRPGREHEDLSFESRNEYDIILNINGLSKAEAASLLIKKLFAFLSSKEKFPHPALIDSTNQIGYSKIAFEFQDSLRITTKNFHDASAAFWQDYFDSISNDNNQKEERVLEIGSGNGWLINSFGQHRFSWIDCLDISPNMHVNYATNYFTGTARCIPVKSDFYEYVLGSLCDPFLYPEVFVEVWRVLRPGGHFVITVPSKKWSDSLPGRKGNKTTFTLLSGENIEVFSFCNAKETLDSLNTVLSFSILLEQSLSLGTEYMDPISPSILGSVDVMKKGMTASSIPIVTAITCKKC